MPEITISVDEKSRKAGKTLTIEVPASITEYAEGVKAYGKEAAEQGYQAGMVVRFQTAFRRFLKKSPNATPAEQKKFIADWKPGEGRKKLTAMERLLRGGYTEAEAKKMLKAIEK